MLAALLSADARDGETTRPVRLLAAMRHATLGGGKRLRPFLLLETARLFGACDAGAVRAAAALEMVHCYSLVHDDLPAMDDDDLRRGRPAVHKAFDEATAILAGDSLLTYAFEIMADPATHADPAIRAALVLGLARAAGMGGMAGGQALDLAAESALGTLSQTAILQMQAMKTGALLLYAVQAGAILGGAQADARAALAQYGGALGAAFQIADDILDATGDAASMGKRTGKDAGRNKATLVAALGMQAACAQRDALVARAQQALLQVSFRNSSDSLAQAARFVGQRQS